MSLSSVSKNIACCLFLKHNQTSQTVNCQNGVKKQAKTGKEQQLREKNTFV